MSTVASRIFIPGRARVYLGPVGTPQPTDPNGVYDPALTEVGYFSQDSLKFTTAPTFEVVRAHQSDFPVRRYQTEDDATIECDLQEWSATSFQSVFGGGSVTQVTTGIWKYSPPALGGRTEIMAVVKATDGVVSGGATARTYAFVIPRALQIQGIDTALNKTTNAILPLRLSVLGADTGDSWYMLTSDDPAWSTAVPVYTSRSDTGGPAAGGTAVTITGSGLNTLSSVWFGRTGTATAGSATTITDSGATGWVTNGFQGGTVLITAGTGIGQSRAVVSNTATAITVATWTTTPDATSVYMVYKPATSFFVNGAGTSATAVSPASVASQVMWLLLPNTVGTTVNGGAGSAFTYS